MKDIENLRLLAWTSIFFLIFLSQAILFYVAYFKLDELEKQFSISDGVEVNLRIMGSGPAGRFHRLRHISALLGCTNHLHLNDPGAFIAAELVPDNLKKWITFPDGLLFIGVSGGAFLWTLDKFRNLQINIESPMSELQLIYAATWIALLVLTFMSLALMVFVGCFKLEKIEMHLENSRFVEYYRKVKGNGFFGRKYRLGHIRTLLQAPDSFLLEIDPDSIDDLNYFPQQLERWVIIPHRLAAFSILGLLVTWGWGTHFGL